MYLLYLSIQACCSFKGNESGMFFLVDVIDWQFNMAEWENIASCLSSTYSRGNRISRATTPPAAAAAEEN